MIDDFTHDLQSPPRAGSFVNGEPRMETTRYRQIIGFATETVWAILPAKLAEIKSLLELRAAGIRLAPEQIEAAVGTRKQAPAQESRGKVAVLPLWGTLVPHADLMTEMSGGTAIDSWMAAFNKAAADPAIDTILISVNSPGGSAAGITEASRAVREAAATKRVIAVADPMAASAALSIATQATEFYAAPSALVGSLGAYSIHEDVSQQLAAEGIKITVVEAPDPDEGGMKMADSPFGPLEGDALARRQAIVDSFYRTFVADVAAGRSKSPEAVEATFGKGSMLTSAEALNVGMIDGIASFDEVVAMLARGRNPARGLAQAQAQQPANVEWTMSNPEITGYGLEVTDDEIVGLDVAASAGFLSEQVGGYLQIFPQQQSPHVPAQTGERSTTMTVISDGTTPATREELAAERASHGRTMDELRTNATGREFSTDEQSTFDAAGDRVDEIDRIVASMDARDARILDQARRQAAEDATVLEPSALLDRATSIPKPSRLPDNPWELSAYDRRAGSIEQRAELWRDGAKKVNERLDYQAKDPDACRAFVERLLTRDSQTAQAESFGHRVLITSDPDYDKAFGEMVMRRPLSQHSRNLIDMAVSHTGLGSESPVPITIDPTVLFSGDGSLLPIRQIARVIPITTLKWQGISSDGVEFTYDGEDAVITPQDPDFDAPQGTVVRATAEVQFTIEVDQDWGSFRTELARLYAQAKRDKEANKFLHGDGTGEPEGLIFALDALGSPYVIETDDPDTLLLEDVELVTDELPPYFDPDATWLASKAFYTNVRRLAGTAGRIDVWVPLAQGFASRDGLLNHELLGYGAAVGSEVSKAFDTGGENVAVLGDFSNFAIIDRIGMNIELDLHPRDTNGKWTGRRSLIAYFRNTSKVLVPNAFRMLQIKDS